MALETIVARFVATDEALATWLNVSARRSVFSRELVSRLASGLASVEIVLMVSLAVTGQRGSALSMLAAVGVVYAASETLGAVWPRERPFARIGRVVPLMRHTPDRSMPSRHIASGLAMAAIGGREHPRLGTTMAAVAWTLGLSRVAAGVHYPSDVLAGAVLGQTVGALLRT